MFSPQAGWPTRSTMNPRRAAARARSDLLLCAPTLAAGRTYTGEKK